MPRKPQRKPLNALELPTLPAGMHPAGEVSGLYIQVQQSGGRSWILRTMIGGRRREIGLGGYPTVKLADARQKARDALDGIKKGIDPVSQRAAARTEIIASRPSEITFDEASSRFIAAKESEWKNAKHGAQWVATLNTYASPVIGKMRVQDVSLAHVLNILEPIWATKTETAARLRGRIESVLSWATVRGYRQGENPARWKGHLDAILAAPSKVAKTKHHAALSWRDLGAFMAKLRKQEGMGARALEFAILCAARSGEVRGMRWNEVDFDNGVWTCPAERMKAGKAHRVPMSDAALDLLRRLPNIDDNELCFPAPRGGMLSDMTLTAVLRRMQVNAVPHGFRSTFRDWSAEVTAYPRDMAEMALAHSIGDKVEAAYRRGDMLDKRRRMMEDWAAFCNVTSELGDVIPLRGAA